MSASAVPQRIGNYELIEEIGHGSMGRVWRARDPRGGPDVAVKISEQPENDSSRGERRRQKLFFNEVNAAGVLNHPNIVATLDAGVEDDRRYIVMEYVAEARTLADFARKDRLLPVGNVLAIMRECAEAFGYAHSMGVVHRDIKPTNIMIDKRGRVKIGDFGVALIDRVDVDHTQVIGRLGSPRYMPPEQLLGEQVNSQADIYSLGVVTYELLTGVSPFAGKTVGEIARKVLKEPHRPIREVNPAVPEQLAAVIDRTLKKHPAGRYSSAVELAADLQLIQEDLEYTDLRRTGPDARKVLEYLSCFEGFSTSDLEELLEIASWEEFQEGDPILTEGSGDSTAVVVINGRAAVTSGDTRVSRLGPGSAFGDFGLLEAGEEGASLRAVERCTVLRIGASQVERLSPGCASRLYRLFAASYAARLQEIQRRIGRRGPG